jgi:hypothetical protein
MEKRGDEHMSKQAIFVLALVGLLVIIADVQSEVSIVKRLFR